MVDWGQADDVVFGSPTLVHQVDDVGAAQSHAAFKKWVSKCEYQKVPRLPW